MNPGHLDLLRAAPDSLDAIAVGLAATGEVVRDGAHALVASSPQSWSGSAAVSAAELQRVLHGMGVLLATDLQERADAVRRAAAQVRECQARADAAHAHARAIGLLVGGDGSVTGPPERAVDVVRVRSMIGAAVRDYAAVAMTVGRVGRALPALSVPIPPASSASDPHVARWFASLDPIQQALGIIQHPDLVGSTDGLPAWARDRANRIRLALARARITEALRRETTGIALGEHAGLAVGPRVREQRIRRLEEQVGDLDAIEDLLSRPDRPRQLLALDTTHRVVTAAVSTGDVDAATHLAVFVPGFRTTVEQDLALHDRRLSSAADLAASMLPGSPDGSVVAIAWLGYPAPQPIEVLGPRSVLSDAVAAAGAVSLARFLGGLDTASRVRGGTTQRLTLWAHSYGSTTAGIALRDHRPRVDALVVAGSPGLGVREPRPLGIAPQQIFVAAAVDDPVTRSQWLGADPGSWPDVQRIRTDAARLPDGRTGRRSAVHDEYWEPGSTSAWSMAAIAAGREPLLRPPVACPERVVVLDQSCRLR